MKNIKKRTRNELKSVSGGYSYLYCAAHSIKINILGWKIHTGHTGGSKWDACRAEKD